MVVGDRGRRFLTSPRSVRSGRCDRRHADVSAVARARRRSRRWTPTRGPGSPTCAPSAPGATRAVARLHALLLRAARFEVARRAPRCPTCAATASTISRSRRRTTRWSACWPPRRLPRREPVHHLGLQVRAPGGRREAAPAGLAAARGAAGPDDGWRLLRERGPGARRAGRAGGAPGCPRGGDRQLTSPRTSARAPGAGRQRRAHRRARRAPRPRAAPSTRRCTTRGASCGAACRRPASTSSTPRRTGDDRAA